MFNICPEQDADRAREEITSLFAAHVSGIKKIYEDTSFTNKDGTLRYTGISFVVHRVKVGAQFKCEWCIIVMCDKAGKIEIARQ